MVVVGRWVLTCWYLFLSLSFCGCWWWLVVVAIVAATVVLRGEGGVVVWWKEMVEFRMLVEFEPREFRHMTLMRLLKMRRYFKLSLTRNQSHGFNLCVEASISPLFLKKF